MALIKLSSMIIEIRGRFGGVYFKKDNTGQHVQAMPRSVRKASMEGPVIRPHSPGGSRSAYTKSWTYVASMWGILILTVYLPLWIAKTLGWRHEDKKGNNVKLTPWGWFTHFNILRSAKGLPIYWRPPRSPKHLPDMTIVGDNWMVYYSTGLPSRQHDTIGLYKASGGGTFNGKPYYIADVYSKGLWWDNTQWVVSGNMGTHMDPYWYKTGTDPIGVYQPHDPDDKTLNVNY